MSLKPKIEPKVNDEVSKYFMANGKIWSEGKNDKNLQPIDLWKWYNNAEQLSLEIIFIK